MSDEAAATSLEDLPASAWDRFLAKQVDGLVVLALTFATGFGLGFLDMAFGTAIVSLLTTAPPLTAFAFNTAITLAVWFAYDVSMLAMFRTTAGKAAMGLRVSTDSGVPVFSAFAGRSALVLVLGLALFIPVLSAIAMIASYVRVESGKRAIWDSMCQTRVSGPPAAGWRVALGAVAWGTAILLTIYLRLSGAP